MGPADWHGRDQFRLEPKCGDTGPQPLLDLVDGRATFHLT